MEELLTDLVELVTHVLRLGEMPLVALRPLPFDGIALTSHKHESRADVIEWNDGEITRSPGKEEPLGLLVNGRTRAGCNGAKLLGRGLLRLLGLLGLLGLTRLLGLLVRLMLILA